MAVTASPRARRAGRRPVCRGPGLEGGRRGGRPPALDPDTLAVALPAEHAAKPSPPSPPTSAWADQPSTAPSTNSSSHPLAEDPVPLRLRPRHRSVSPRLPYRAKQRCPVDDQPGDRNGGFLSLGPGEATVPPPIEGGGRPCLATSSPRPGPTKESATRPPLWSAPGKFVSCCRNLAPRWSRSTGRWAGTTS